jgi:hypothetical protein
MRRAALVCDLMLAAGTAVDVELPDAGGVVTGRVVRARSGVVAVVFHQDPAARARVDRAVDAPAGARRAA